jgi:Cut8, nuclear proteasome tether protein
LYESKNWDALLDYVSIAWNYVRATPIWDNHAHNAVRRHCFKILSYHAQIALRHGGVELGHKRVDDFEARLNDMAKDCDEVTTCQQCIGYIKQRI